VNLTGLTIAQARRTLTEAFAAENIESAEADARLLIGEVLSLNHATLVTHADRPIAASDATRIEAYTIRRLAHEPVARILGRKEFWSLPLSVTPAVLVPRPETETLVELALDHVVSNGLQLERLRVLDIGTGSGALVLALLSELDNASGVATDSSVAALKVARDNARDLGFASRCTFVAANFTDPLAGPFDLIVSNPPYIPHQDIEGLPRDVRSFDPHLALDGGHDGLAAYRAILGSTLRLLATDGHFILELGAGQDAAVTALAETAGFVSYGVRKDLAGIPRALELSPPE
jgi:release factor glutamine methyltransferase